MGGSSCLICRRTWKHKNVSMFTVPKNNALRLLWNQACDRLLRKNGRMCEKHFRKEDFIEYEECLEMKRKRLKKNAVPSLLLKRDYSDNADKSDEIMSQTDETMTVEFLNEEFFDDTTEALDENYEMNDDDDASLVLEDAVTELDSHTQSISEMAGSTDDTVSWGVIQKEEISGKYTINCLHCEKQFPLWLWTSFVKHLDDEHTRATQVPEETTNDTANISIEFDDIAEAPPQELDQPADLLVFCTLCRRDYRYGVVLQKHYTSYHRAVDVPHKCSRCYWRYAAEAQLVEHERMHTASEVVFCVTCNKGFADDDALSQHMTVHRECTICHTILSSTTNYRKHMLSHMPPKLKCELCPKRFRYASLLRDHLKAHQNQRDHVCEECGKSFVRRKTLWDHRGTVHAGFRLYSCKICNTSYKTYANLHFHRLRAHLPLEGSVEELALRADQPTRKSANTQRLECPVCGMSLKNAITLRRHTKMKHGVVQLDPAQVDNDEITLLSTMEEGPDFAVETPSANAVTIISGEDSDYNPGSLVVMEDGDRNVDDIDDNMRMLLEEIENV